MGGSSRADRYEIQLPKNAQRWSGIWAAEQSRGLALLWHHGLCSALERIRSGIMEEEPERLAEIKGISERKAREIGEQMIENSQMQNAMIFLAQYGISLTLGIKIYNQYQDMLYQVLRENPYKLAEDIQGVGFKIADEIAGRAGIRADSEYRIRSGLFYTLSRAGAEGHLYLPREELLERAGSPAGVGHRDSG